MARVGGLTPVERIGDGAVDRGNARLDTAPNRPAPGLRPAASPVNLYSRPAQPEASNLDQLASALAKLNPALEKFAESGIDEDKARQEAAAAGKIGGMTFEEAQKAVDEGSIHEMQNPWFKAAFMKQYGQRAALKQAAGLADQYQNKFDRENGDVEQLIAGTAKPTLDKFGNDRHFLAGYTSVFNPAAAKLRAEQDQYKASRVAGEVRQGVYEVGTGIISQGIQKGQSADEIVANVRTTYAGNKTLLNVPYAEQDAEVFRIAETLTNSIEGSSNPKLQREVVEKLLNGDRTAPDGKQLGSLANNRNFASKAVNLLEKADASLRKVNDRTAFDRRMHWDEQATQGTLSDKSYEELQAEHAANPGRFTDGFVLSLKHRSDAVLEARRAEVAAREEKVRIRQLADQQRGAVLEGAAVAATRDGMWTVGDAQVIGDDGTMKTLSAQKVKEQTRDLFLQSSAAKGGDGQFDREVEWFSRNSEVTHPRWESLLKSGYAQATQSTLSGSQAPKGFNDAIALYANLRAKAPQLVGQYVSGDALKFYDAAVLGQEMGQDPLTAARNSFEINKDPTKFETSAWRKKFDELKAAVRQSNNRAWGPDGMPSNAGEIINEIDKQSEYFSKLGYDNDVALKASVDNVTRNWTRVNGALVKTGDQRIPKDMGPMAERYIANYAAKYGVDADDLTIRSVGNAAGHWRIVSKSNYGMTADKPEGTFTMSQLAAFEKARKEAELQVQVQKANEKAAERGADIGRREQLRASPPEARTSPWAGPAGYGNAVAKPITNADRRADLDAEEAGLKRSGLGGAFFAARMRSINERRAKLKD